MIESSSPALYQLSPCTVLRLRGPDRLRYLNGQVTQDVRLATETRAVYSAVLNGKGQLEAVCHIREHDDSFLLDAPLDLREPLLARLERYIIADDVELQDESNQWHLAHLINAEVPEGQRAWQSIRLEEAGYDLLSRVPVELPGVETASADDFERRRIRAGLPAWGAELTPGLLPPDARLDRTAISYEKGCYLGQEVISRMKRAGKTNQELVRLVVPAGTPCGALLVHEETEAGRITSVEPAGSSPGETVSALGFRKRKVAELSSFSVRTQDGQALPGEAKVSPAV